MVNSSAQNAYAPKVSLTPDPALALAFAVFFAPVFVVILSEVAHAFREQRSRRTPKPSIDPYPPDLSAHHSGVAFIVVCPSSPYPKTVILSAVAHALREQRSRRTCGRLCRCLFFSLSPQKSSFQAKSLTGARRKT